MNGFASLQVASGDNPAAFGLMNFANKTGLTLNPFEDPPPGPQTFDVNVTRAVPGLAQLTLNTGPAGDTVSHLSWGYASTTASRQATSMVG